MARSPHGQVPPITKCVFCGAAPPSLTNEHIFSHWTHRYMLPRRPAGKDMSSRGFLYVDQADMRRFKLPGQVRDWQVK